MKAVRFHEYGGPEVLRYEDADRPRPQRGQVLVRVAATSFNPVDVAMRAGFLRQVFPVTLPHTPGIDVAGTVAELGDGVEEWSIGDAVTEPAGVVLNLVTVSEEEMAGLRGLVVDGGVIVSTTSPATDDPGRGVRAVNVFARSDAGQLATIVGRVDSGELRVDVSERFPLSELARVHELGASGKFRGKVLLTPEP